MWLECQEAPPVAKLKPLVTVNPVQPVLAAVNGCFYGRTKARAQAHYCWAGAPRLPKFSGA